MAAEKVYVVNYNDRHLALRYDVISQRLVYMKSGQNNHERIVKMNHGVSLNIR